jgi:hypothetical protein
MSYLLIAPIPWIPFDPPSIPNDLRLDVQKCSRCVVHPGLLRGPGLERMLGRDLFDHMVDWELLEPIP